MGEVRVQAEWLASIQIEALRSVMRIVKREINLCSETPVLID